MATLQERAELHKTIWKIANDLRGSVDGWEFKDLKAAKHLFKNKCYYHHNANDRFGPNRSLDCYALMEPSLTFSRNCHHNSH